MPTHLRLKCSAQFFDQNPKNQAVINPCFRRQMDIADPLSGTNAQQLVDDMVAYLRLQPGLSSTPLVVSAYNVEAPPKTPPMAIARSNVGGAVKDPGLPPELAVCLSFFSGQNRASYRGRLYMPVWFFSSTAADLGTKIPTSLRTQAANFVSGFAGLGGANVDWGVWSSTTHAFHKATDYFVSDAWAIQRSRGIQETARTKGTTSG
jgi:hypothetical protein